MNLISGKGEAMTMTLPGGSDDRMRPQPPTFVASATAASYYKATSLHDASKTILRNGVSL